MKKSKILTFIYQVAEVILFLRQGQKQVKKIIYITWY
jgi:hypothetical protein